MNCDKLLCIVFTEPTSTLTSSDKYVHAFSFNNDLLKNMLIKNVPKEYRDMYSIETFKPTLMHNKTQNTSGNIQHIIFSASSKRYEYITKPKYGINIEINGECRQGLLFVDENEIEYIKKYSTKILDISENPLEIDKFYPEGILNT